MLSSLIVGRAARRLPSAWFSHALHRPESVVLALAAISSVNQKVLGTSTSHPLNTARNYSLTTDPYDEVGQAQDAASSVGGGVSDIPPQETIFTKILNKEIPADIVYEDDKAIAFRDVNPVSPVHILVIPRKPLPTLSQATDSDTELLGHLLQVARRVAKQETLEEGYRIVINNGRHASQSVYHLHVHLMGGRQFGWPPG